MFLVYFYYHLGSAIHREAFNHATIGMALISLDGRWLKVNSCLCNMLGFSKSELLTKTLQDVVHIEDWKSDLANIRELLALGKQESYQAEKRFSCKNGKAILIFLSISLVRHPQGKPLYLIGHVQDVSGYKTTEHWIVDRMVNLTAQLNSEIDELKSQGTYNPSGEIENILAEMEFFGTNSRY